MRYVKYPAIALGLIGTLLAIGWLLRNAIIERISNPLLAQYGLRVTGVSLDALATRDATISYLELEHANGATIAVDNLILPIAALPDGFRTYAAEKITIDLPAAGDAVSPDPAGVLDQLLALPALLPRTLISIAAISVSPYPEIRNARWLTAEDGQELTLLVDSTVFSTRIAAADDAKHRLEFSFADASGATDEQTITVEMQHTADSFALHGSSELELALWKPLAELLGIDNIDIQSGTASLRFSAETRNAPRRDVALYADLAPTSPVHLTYFGAPDGNVSLTLESAKPFEITATLPDLEWLVRQADASLLASYGAMPDIRLSLINQTCHAVLACSGEIGIVVENATLPSAAFDRLEFLATQELSSDDNGLAVRILPNASFMLTGASGPDVSLAQFDATLTSLATVSIAGDAWQFSAASIDLGIESLAYLNDISVSTPMFLDKVEVSQEDQTMFATLGVYASASEIAWDGQTIRVPGFSGGISRQGDEIAVILETDGLHAEAGIEISHNLERNTGRLAASSAILSFDAQALSSRISPWPNDWDISAGTFGIGLQAEWQQTDTAWHIAGQSSVRMNDLGGAYNDIAFLGLSTRIDAGFDSNTGLALEPSAIAIALIEAGLPVENISADYLLHAGELAVDVNKLRMHAFGGLITAEPFSFSTANDSNTLLIHAESIDLGRIMSMQEFESVEISGSIGAELPVSIGRDSVTITGGSLTGEPPGGVIRYLPGIAADESDLSALGIATRALSNFEYDTLTSVVDYTTDGDLNLQMRLAGRNPDLEDSRPVILNLGVENNVPQMLRSLRAARTVEDILERRLAQ